MIFDTVIKIIVCPSCRNKIIKEGIKLICTSCRKRYSISCDIANFSVSKLSPDVDLSQQKWEKIYSSPTAVKKNYKKDTTVLSYKRFLDKYKGKIKKGIFLDLGCGVAYVSAMLAQEGVKVLGLDISEEALIKSSILFEKEKINGSFLKSDLLNLPIKDNAVQFIYSCMSLEYVRNTQKAIDEAYRVLKPGGIFIAIVPVVSLTTLTYHQLRGDIPNLPILRNLFEWFHIKLSKGRYMNYGYEQSFTPSLLKKMFKNAKFKVNKIDYFDMHYPITFIPEIVRPYFQKLLRYRPFWPLVYVEALKP